jgi:hypothetical protein
MKQAFAEARKQVEQTQTFAAIVVSQLSSQSCSLLLSLQFQAAFIYDRHRCNAANNSPASIVLFHHNFTSR